MGLISIKDYSPKALDNFFFDTNVWILLFGDIANFQRKEQAKYSNILQTLLSRKSTIYLTSNVISEFSNVLLKKTFKDWSSKTENIAKEYKRDFVGNDIYLQQIGMISNLINKIINLPCVERIPDDFNAIQLERILERFKLIDFNDAYIAEICESKALKLVTNDRDFFILKDNIDIISALE